MVICVSVRLRKWLGANVTPISDDSELDGPGSALEVAEEHTKVAEEETKQAKIRYNTVCMATTIGSLAVVFLAGLILNPHDTHFLSWFGGCLVAIGVVAKWFLFGYDD